MEVSKSYTVDAYGEGQAEKYRRGWEEVFGDKEVVKQKVEPLTPKEVARKDLEGVWLDYLNGGYNKESFLESVLDYVFSKQFSKVLRSVKARKS